MKKILYITLIGIGLMIACNKKPQKTINNFKKQHKIIGYIGGFRGDFKAESIDAKKLTHINYAFANVKRGKAILENRQDSSNLIELQKLKLVNPDLKILVSIGGWTWSKKFSKAALTDSSRKIFTKSAVDLLIKYKLDGIDIDWEYPGQKGDNNDFRLEDKENFTLFLNSLRVGLTQQGLKDSSHYLLTIATGANQNYLDHTEMYKVHHYLDFINIMTYDFHGEWEDKTGHHTNLFTNDSSEISAEKAVLQHVKAGVPIDKIVLGVAFYGRAWHKASNINHGLNQKAKIIPYHFHTTYDTIQNHLVNKNGYIRYWDSTAAAPFLYNDSLQLFVTYDDTMSIRKKCNFIKKMNMGGAMFWEYTEDSKNSNNRLLDVLDKNLK